MKIFPGKSENGFTIVEVLVAIAVGAILVGSLSQVVTSYVHVNQRGRYLNLANAFVEAKTEGLRNTGFSAIPIGTTDLVTELPTKLPPSRASSMVVTSPMGGIKQIDITISYSDQGKTISHAYTTYIGELGVGQ